MLKWVFGADTGPFRRGLNEMRTETTKFGSSMKGYLVGALGLGAITAGFRAMFVEMDRVQKLGIRFGETAETIQKISLASDLAGASLETVAKGITVATRNAQEAATGNIEYAESFARLGIDAAEFVNLPMEQKILLLAGAMEQGKGSGENLANMMEVLGRSGGELIPLLSQGQQELQKQFAETSTVSQSTVDSIAAFNDEITKLKQQAQVVGGTIINGFRMIFGTIGTVIGAAVNNAMTTFSVLIEGATSTGKIIKKALSGDLGGAADEAKRFKTVFENALETTKNNITATGETLSEMMDEIYGPRDKPTGGPSVEDAIAAEEAKTKILKDREKLTEDIAKLEEEARQNALTLEEKINEAIARRAELSDKILSSDETESLEARKEELEVEKTLAALRKEQAAEQQRVQDKAAQQADKLAALASQERDVDRANEMAGMTDEQRMAFLAQERDDLNETASTTTDPLLAAESRIAAKERQGEIDALARSEIEAKQSEVEAIAGPSVTADSLAEVAGGGNVASFGKTDFAERQTMLQRQILDILQQWGGGTEKFPSPLDPSA